MTVIELMPCPICLSEAIIKKRIYDIPNLAFYEITCAKNNRHGFMKSKYEDVAIEKWNAWAKYMNICIEEWI